MCEKIGSPENLVVAGHLRKGHLRGGGHLRKLDLEGVEQMSRSNERYEACLYDATCSVGCMGVYIVL